jgi:hypothetical protein
MSIFHKPTGFFKHYLSTLSVTETAYYLHLLKSIFRILQTHFPIIETTTAVRILFALSKWTLDKKSRFLGIIVRMETEKW